jgi:hypothetical protein
MFKLISILYFVFMSCSVNKQIQTYTQPPLDSVFISWNKSTFKSLNRQAKLATDSLQRTFYENRLLSVKEYWRIKNINDVNNGSIRYKFLKTVFAKLDDKKKDFYIIEANESGSKFLLRTFVLYKDSSNTIDVEFYDYFNEIWQKTGKFKKENFYLQANLKNYVSQFSKGFNYDDIILTEFKNGQVNQSEYYLYSTLSTESKIKNILDGYRKENFTK